MERDPALNNQSFPPWLGARLRSLLELRPSIRLDGERTVLLRALRSDRLPLIRVVSGLVVDRSVADGHIALTHEWHSTRTRGTGALGRNPHCGLANYTMRGEELVRMESPEDPHLGSTLYTATTEAGRLNELRSPLFDPFFNERARRAAEEVIGHHPFVSQAIVAGLGQAGLQVAPVHA